jgi:hypothetical protein
MKKKHAEAAIRLLSRQWLKAVGNPDHPTFSDFLIWLRFKGYAHYLQFDSFAGPERDARSWFDDEFKKAVKG